MRHETVIAAVDALSTNYDTFTPPELKEQRVKLLRDAFKHKLDSSFKTAVDSVLHDENIKKFPTLVQIENYMPKITNRQQQFCDICKGTGYFNVWQFREKAYYSFAYACNCNNEKHAMPVIDPQAIALKPHNPYPPRDKRHDEYNSRS